MIRIIANCYPRARLKIIKSIEIRKRILLFSNLRECSIFPLSIDFHTVMYVITYPIKNNYPCPKNSNSVLTREEFGLASENAIVPAWQLHPGTIVLCAPINSAHAVIRDIVVHAKRILPAPHSRRYLDTNDRYRLIIGRW